MDFVNVFLVCILTQVYANLAALWQDVSNVTQPAALSVIRFSNLFQPPAMQNVSVNMDILLTK